MEMTLLQNLTMNSNLPPGTQEHGAPWNDQEYIVNFTLKFYEFGVKFTSQEIEIPFALTGPNSYTYTELLDEALYIIDEEMDLGEFEVDTIEVRKA